MPKALNTTRACWLQIDRLHVHTCALSFSISRFQRFATVVFKMAIRRRWVARYRGIIPALVYIALLNGLNDNDVFLTSVFLWFFYFIFNFGSSFKPWCIVVIAY